MLSNVADPLRSQEELIQVKHGDNTWTIEIYQGNKLTLTKLESGRGFFFFQIIMSQYSRLGNVQGRSSAPASITLSSHRVHDIFRRPSYALRGPQSRGILCHPDNTLPLFKMKIKLPPPPVFLVTRVWMRQYLSHLDSGFSLISNVQVKC